MENTRYIRVADKGGEKEAAALLESLEAGYVITNATGSNGCVHYVLIYMPPMPYSANEHELDEEDMRIIEDNIDASLKGIKNGEA